MSRVGVPLHLRAGLGGLDAMRPKPRNPQGWEASPASQRLGWTLLRVRACVFPWAEHGLSPRRNARKETLIRR